jgi:CBS-domain-containing membrane protein
MVSPVITARKSATVREIAKILLEKRISAVPVVDDVGKLVGIVTESDLLRRAEAGTEHPYSWWVHFLAGDATIAADYIKSHAAKVDAPDQARSDRRQGRRSRWHRQPG